MRRTSLRLFAAPLALAVIAACGDAPEAPPPADDTAAEAPTTAFAGLAPAQQQWMTNLAAQCGQAFPGQLERAPEGSTMLEGPELLVVYFDVCEEDEARLPFHIEQMDGEWDRSRTWIFRPDDDGTIELRHDHRLPDGSEDEGSTWYGAWTKETGTATQQEFLREELRNGAETGWRVIIEPGVRYVYGTIRDGEWSWRVDFDLSQPMDDPPPPAWGYEDGAGPPR